MHHEIVSLERIHQPLPDSFDFPAGTTYNLTCYDTTPTRELLHERIRNATIIIVTARKIDAEALSVHVAPRLVLVAVMATGTDLLDLEACRKRGLRVINCPGANLDAVSEHAISLYFAARRRTVTLDAVTRRTPSEWKKAGSLNNYMRLPDGKPPLTCKDEVLGIIGYGGLGKRIEALGRALGMQVLIAARKDSSPVPSSNGGLATPNADGSRVPFEEVLRRATVLVLSLPRTPQTTNLISTPEFNMMNQYAVLINIARGGIVNEAAVVQALKDSRIAGYSTDVYDVEPCGDPEDSPLFGEDAKDLNITLSPHLAWFAQRTLTNLGQILKNTLEAWVAGNAINVIV